MQVWRFDRGAGLAENRHGPRVVQHKGSLPVTNAEAVANDLLRNGDWGACRGEIRGVVRCGDFLALRTADAPGAGALRNQAQSCERGRDLVCRPRVPVLLGSGRRSFQRGLEAGRSERCANSRLRGSRGFGLRYLPSAALRRFSTSSGSSSRILPGSMCENEWAVAYAANLLDAVADLFEHFAEFAVPAFDEDDLVPGIIDRARGTSFAAGFAGAEAAVSAAGGSLDATGAGFSWSIATPHGGGRGPLRWAGR